MKLYRMEPELKALYGAMRYVAGGKPVRSPEWLDRIRMMDCSRCGHAGPSDPHHILGSIGPLKTSDTYTIPLCRECHVIVEGTMAHFVEVFAIWFKLNDIFIREQVGWE